MKLFERGIPRAYGARWRGSVGEGGVIRVGDWKTGALRGLRGNVTSFAAGTRCACSFIYKRSRRRDKRRVTRFRPIIILNFVVLILTV